MQLNRRTLLASAASAASLPRAAWGRAGEAIAYVGTYTPSGRGIHPFRFDPATGVLTPTGAVTEMRNPTWLSLDAARGRLFALSEVDDYGPGKTGSVSAFAIEPRTGALVRRGEVSSGGAGPAYISLHPSGRFLFAANYGGGSVAVLRVREDGSLSEPVDVRQLTSPPGFDPSRSLSAANLAVSDHSKPHMHMIAADPSGRFVLADDAGSDRICVWRFDMESGRLIPAVTPFVPTPPGSAPRHFVFHPNGRWFYDLQEHDAALAAYGFDPQTGALTLRQTVSTLPESHAGSDVSSELAISRDGRFLYAANRLRNALTVFAVGPAGQVRKLGETWVQADYPRSFGLDPSERFLVSCNQKSDSLTVFRVGPAGGLTFTGQFAAVGSPAAIVFHRLE